MNKISSKKMDDDALLLELQIELVKMQKHIIENKERVLVIFEGRDAAGKDGTIKRVVEYLSPRETHVVALSKPSEHENGEWYFQRYISHLPAHGELVFFNRSWYNRAGVEPVMGFCSASEYQRFMKTVNIFETMLVDDGITIIKYYLDISKKEQAERLLDRKNNPLKQWKTSPIDEVAQKKWGTYSKYRNSMLLKTNHISAPWNIIHANNKKLAHLNVIRDLLSKINYPNKNKKILKLDPDIICTWKPGAAELPALEK
ncbi:MULTISPECIES: polyphosphate kinase 2 [unclassified Polynucleobacter]|uniref:polyphosphate kinase 2 n=1 Tax=unclassified Polynucleobacter TaxID=2640945 RepID=UPI002490E395|nr:MULTISPECIES: polyphosphate kinase 2 [unclassified Polynucleobacter]